MKHATWDDGAIDGALYDVFGMAPERKTSKTLCGKRVAVKLIDYGSGVTCPDCITERHVQEQATAVLKTDGLDAAIAHANASVMREQTK